MSHNKMYREIEGYEDALYFTSSTKDLLDDAYESIQYGEERDVVISKFAAVEAYISKIKSVLDERGR